MDNERMLLEEKKKQDEKRIRMTTLPHEKLIFKLAVPSIISMLITSFYNLVDTFFVGQLENTYIVDEKGNKRKVERKGKK